MSGCAPRHDRCHPLDKLRPIDAAIQGALVGLRGTGQRARPKSDQRSNSGVEQAVAEAVVSGADADPGVLAAHEVGGDDAVLVLAEQDLQLAPL